MLFGLGAEAQGVDMGDDFAEVVAAADAVLDLAEDLADLVFDGVGAGGALAEALEVGEEPEVGEVAQVVAGEGGVVVQRAVGVFGGGPGGPAVGGIEDVAVGLAFEGGDGGAVLFQAVEVFEEEEPGGLLGVVQLRGAAGFLPEDVVYVAEGLVEQGDSRLDLPGG